jgi:phosphatidylserine decarboxylase
MSPYARLEVILIALLGGLLTAGVAWYLAAWAFVPAGLTLALLGFYRDPGRIPPRAADLILAPADGTVVEVARDVALPDGGRGVRIMIFLSVLNVHMNRSPCAGHVAAVEYRPGQFRNALSADADRHNECNTVTLTPADPLPGPVRVRQIAGVLARRIVCAARPGDRLAAGQRYGMIKLGSRTEVCLPEHPSWEVLVRVGDKARGGLTVLARWRTSEQA